MVMQTRCLDPLLYFTLQRFVFFFSFMQDNARPHTARFVENFFEAETVQCMEWLVFSSDLNLIEHVRGHT